MDGSRVIFEELNAGNYRILALLAELCRPTVRH